MRCTANNSRLLQLYLFRFRFRRYVLARCTWRARSCAPIEFLFIWWCIVPSSWWPSPIQFVLYLENCNWRCAAFTVRCISTSAPSSTHKYKMFLLTVARYTFPLNSNAFSLADTRRANATECSESLLLLAFPFRDWCTTGTTPGKSSSFLSHLCRAPSSSLNYFFPAELCALFDNILVRRGALQVANSRHEDRERKKKRSKM